MAIIIISREMGTGAYQIAKEVARKLKYTLVDGAKIAELAPRYGLTPEILERVDEKPPVYNNEEDRKQAANLNKMELLLLDIARKGNVIFYGRGGQDLLADLHNVLRLRITAPLEERVEKFAEREWMDPDLVRELIRKSDHQRGGFINYYFDRDWRDPLCYDLVYNTSRLSPSAIVEGIVAASRDKYFSEHEEESQEMIEDLILRKRLETELMKCCNAGSLRVKVEARQGRVVLTGHVYSEEERKKVVKETGLFEGVRQVEDCMHMVNNRPYK